MRYMAFLFSCVLLSGISYGQAEVKESRYIHVGKKFSPEGVPKYLHNSDIKISDSEFEMLMKRHGRVNLIPEFNRYGKASAYYVDTTASTVQRIDPTNRTDPGELLPPFTMVGYNGEVIESENLRGNPVVILYQHYFDQRFYKEEWIEDFETLSKQCTSCNFIMLTGSSRESIMESIGAKEINFHLVPEAHGFMQRYAIDKIPYIILLDQDGVVENYFDSGDPEELMDKFDN